jgi:hypothetical protein
MGSGWNRSSKLVVAYLLAVLTIVYLRNGAPVSATCAGTVCMFAWRWSLGDDPG